MKSKMPSLIALIALLGIAVALVAGASPASAADTTLKAPVAAGITLKVIHGYNDPLPGETCVIGSSSDHCNNQKYGLDLAPQSTSDTNVLAPLPGTVAWIRSDCLGITTDDALNLTVCHFASFAVAENQPVTRGQILGVRSTSWLHLSLDDRRVSPFTPVPFDGAHTIEGIAFSPQSDGVRNQYGDGSQYLTSTNGASTSERARITNPALGATFGGSSVTFTRTNGSGVSSWFLGVSSGTSCGAGDIYWNWFPSQTITVSGVPTDGRSICVRLWSSINNAWQYNDYSYRAATTQTLVKAGITSPPPGSTLPGGSTTFAWSTGSGVTQYFLYVGKSQGANDIFGNSVACCSRSVSGIPTDGSTIWVRMWSYFPSAGWQYNDYSYRAASGSGDRLQAGQQLTPGQSITSANGCFRLIYQTDGNFVLYRMNGYQAIWASNTVGSARNAIMQTDGNLVVYNASGSAVWASNTAGNSGTWLIMQDDGNAVVYRSGGVAIWATNTVRAC